MKFHCIHKQLSGLKFKRLVRLRREAEDHHEVLHGRDNCEHKLDQPAEAGEGLKELHQLQMCQQDGGGRRLLAPPQVAGDEELADRGAVERKQKHVDDVPDIAEVAGDCAGDEALPPFLERLKQHPGGAEHRGNRHQIEESTPKNKQKQNSHQKLFSVLWSDFGVQCRFLFLFWIELFFYRYCINWN